METGSTLTCGGKFAQASTQTPSSDLIHLDEFRFGVAQKGGKKQLKNHSQSHIAASKQCLLGVRKTR